MELFITPTGQVKALYGEEIPMEELGTVSITRASIVEPAAEGGWLVDLSPVGGPVIGPFRYRSQGLDAERQWLLAHHLQDPWRIAAPFPDRRLGRNWVDSKNPRMRCLDLGFERKHLVRGG